MTIDDDPGWVEIANQAGISARRRDGAAMITFNRPDRLNALPLESTVVFYELLQELANDDSVTAVMLTGAGRAFSAGADLGNSFSSDALAAMPNHLRNVTSPTIIALRTMPKPVIAAVNGAAAGVGCAFAIAADLVIASDKAKFVLSFSKLGLSLDGGSSAMLTARTGFGRTMRMALLAEPIHADEAKSIGLADEVVPADEFEKVALKRLTQLASGPREAFAATKELVNANLLPHLTDALEHEARVVERLIASEDFHEAIAATAVGRAPQFGKNSR